MNLHEHLRRATASEHRSLDHGLRYVLGGGLSLERYNHLLAALYGFHVPLEALLARLQSPAAALAVPLLARAELLARDLRALGTEPARVALCDRPPRLVGVDQLAGAFYVVEGASLGGQVIARAVGRQLGVGPTHGAAFFSSGAAPIGARWKAVLGWLQAREAAWQQIAEGACRTFSALSRWLSARGVLDE